MTANTPTNKDKNAENSWKPGFSGFCGGAISTILLMPLDNIKVRLQVNEGASTKVTSSPPTAIEANVTATSKYATPNNIGSLFREQQNPRTRLGAMRMLRGVIKYEGVRGLYQGLAPAVVGSAVSWGGFFYVYEAMKQQLRYVKSMNNADMAYYKTENDSTATRREQPQQQLATLNSWDNFILGTTSGAVMVFVTNPIWLIKLRLQLQMKRTSENLLFKNVTRYDGFWDAFKKIVRSDGILGLYKGTGPALILTSHGGVQFVVYEFLRKHFHYAKAQRSTESSSVMKRFENSLGYLTIGAISKM